MSNISLYQMTAEQQYLNRLLEEAEGELTPELEEALVISQENMVCKAQNYVYAIKEYEAFAQRCADEVARIQGVKKRAENVQKRLKDALLTAMEVYGLPKVQLDTHSLSTRKSSALVVDDEAAVPNDYKKVELSIDKAAIKRALKEGVAVDGVHLQENVSLQIR